MFGLGVQELSIVLLIAFLLVGGKKLPELGRGIGEGIRNFRKGLQGIEGNGKALQEKTVDEEALR